MRYPLRLSIHFLFTCLILLSSGFLWAQEPHYMVFSSAKELQAYLRWTPDAVPLIGAHRGAPQPGFAENSLEAFENALRYAPCVIECDVRKSKDGVLVMMHDKTLERTTTGRGLVRDYTLAELRKLHLKDPGGNITPYRIPTLGEVLEWARARTIVELDVKTPVTAEEIVEAIGRHRAVSYTIVIAYNRDSVLRYHHLNPELVISAPADGPEAVKRLLELPIPPENLIGFVGVSEPAQEVYKQLHARGIRAILGTLGNLDRSARARGVEVYLRLLRNGADMFATDNVPLAAKAIQIFTEEKQPAGVH